MFKHFFVKKRNYYFQVMYANAITVFMRRPTILAFGSTTMAQTAPQMSTAMSSGSFPAFKANAHVTPTKITGTTRKMTSAWSQ